MNSNVGNGMKKTISRFSAICEDEALVQLAWRGAENLQSNESVELLIGRPYPAALRQVVNDFEEVFGCEFPNDLRKFLSKCNGVEFVVIEGVRSLSSVHEVATREFAEPTIWPALVFLDHFQFHDVALHPSIAFYVIGGTNAERNLCLGIENETVVGVYWLERNDDGVRTTKLADSFQSFVNLWCDRGLVDIDWLVSAA